GGDVNWRNLTALNYHYETQPLPTWLAWYAHQLPDGFQKFCVFMVFVIELVTPFLILTPRRVRFIGCGFLVLLQVCILLTGNYCFFNFLTIGLCVLMLDDAALVKFLPKRWRARFLPDKAEQINLQSPAPAHQENLALGEIQVPPSFPQQAPKCRNWPAWLTAPIAIVVLIVSLASFMEVCEWGRFVPDWAVDMQRWLAPFQSINRYGLFTIMTTSRLEIVVEGSNDGKNWLSYEFRYKPGDPKRRPGFVAPHQPRLDWQMWFAALGSYRENPWFVNFCVRLLQGSPEVLALLAHNPFPDAPPHFIRARVYDYHFSTAQERRAQGVWWTREYKGEYIPAISLEDVQAK
ncbi:MAG TPA: lipase maturation factor family protein, partial [Verrucomicrobiae bacterium]|nr:lipase maturation factor family protein [Verrucomicrobiae bacterium]